jgi:hypothetical protein
MDHIRLGACLRRRSKLISKLVDNDPILLMAASKILDHDLKRANVTRNDLFSKSGEANTLNYGHVLVFFLNPLAIFRYYIALIQCAVRTGCYGSVIDTKQLFRDH